MKRAYTLLAKDSVYVAFSLFAHVAAACNDLRAAAVMDSMVQNVRAWKYNGNRYAISTIEGREITPYIYTNPAKFMYGYAIVEEDGRYYIVDKNGKKINASEAYKSILPMEHGAYWLTPLNNDANRETDKIAPAKNPSKIIYSPSLDQAFAGPEEMAVFTDMIADSKYDTIFGPYNGTVITRYKGKYGIIDKKGKEISPPRYDAVGGVFDNRRSCMEGKKFGFLKGNGLPAIKMSYDTVLNFSNALAAVRKDGLWTYIDTSGRQKITEVFEAADYFIYGFAWVKKNGKWGMINTDGVFVVPAKYDNYQPWFYGHLGGSISDRATVKDSTFSLFRWRDKVVTVEGNEVFEFRDGIALVATVIGSFYENGNQYYFIDTTGKRLFGKVFDEAVSFSEGKAAVFINNEWMYINTKGEPLFKLKLDKNGIELAIAGEFHDNRVQIKHHLQSTFLDENGETIIPWVYYQNDIRQGDQIWIKESTLDTPFWRLYDLNSGKLIIDEKYQEIMRESEGLTWVKRDNKWGILNRQGVEVLEPTYDMPFYGNYDNYDYSFKGSLALAQAGSEWWFIDPEGNSVLSQLFKINIDSPRNDSVIPYNENGLYGFKNGYGKWLIKPSFHYLDFTRFNDRELGITVVVDRLGKVGIVDSRGQLIVEPSFKQIGDFREGIAIVISPEGKHGYIRLDGSVLVNPQYASATDFSNGVAWVSDFNNRWALIESASGKRITEWNEYEFALAFSDSVSIIRVKYNWRITDRKGKIMPTLPLDYDQIQAFSDGYAAVLKNGRWGYINKQGELVIPWQFDDASDFKEGIAVVKTSSSQFRFLCKNGKFLTQVSYSYATPFFKGYAVAAITEANYDKKFGMIDRNGKTVFDFIYDKIEFVGDYILTTAGSKWSIYDCNLKELILPVIDHFMPIGKDMVLLGSKGKMGVLYVNEHKIIAPRYDDLAQISDAYVMVRQNGKWGWVDHNDSEIIPCRFDAATPFRNHKALVYVFGMRIQINEKGEMAFPRF
ncbi:MAG: WG repeat-containing protein [Bacteroidetes bacterium]|nr:WG repeat-containing protein [Bacteroidota bacterium]